ncbi:Fe(3+) ABC transporter substrate-binding protein [Streptobacillus felis]|uniref:Fe(3+) ABC transporter substrate-binding protein n=1 Tax=Streptobacillus felis TaxID=1384509 RepID=A0A7Z0PDS3_9FUSO|nr:Fe(3+) ABC transporter substrate-binding protein [Streptobacillus felis]NYV27297.1 Fe(3+) ABC transporter substrate-binding protein [Streptobacillus felis]
MKRLLLLITVLVTNLIFGSGVVNVYTSRHYDSDKSIYLEFERQTGIKVNVVQNNDVSALIKRLELEGKSTDADVFITVGVGDLYTAKMKNLLQPITSRKVLANVPTNFRDKSNNWVGLTYRARILVYNPEKVNVKELSTYEALTDKKWDNRILTRSSSSSYNKHLISFMIAKKGEKSATEWAKGLVENFARSPKGNDRDQAKAVLAGVGDIAIMNSYYMGKMTDSKDPLEREVASKLKIFFPNQKDGGTHINLSGAGITKYSKNKENAVKFVEFLTDKYAQMVYSYENYEYPVNPKTEISPVVKSWGTFKPSKIDFDKIGQNLEKAKFVADSANWK